MKSMFNFWKDEIRPVNSEANELSVIIKIWDALFDIF